MENTLNKKTYIKNIFYIFIISVCIMLSFNGSIAWAGDLSKSINGANEYGYNSLNDTEKEVFNFIGETLEAFIDSDIYTDDLDRESAELLVEYTLTNGESITEDDLCKTASRFLYSNPKYYWLERNYSYELSGNRIKVTFRVAPYYYSYDSRSEADDAIAELGSEWISEIKEAAEEDVFLAALTAHDLIIGNIDYAYNSKGKPEEEIWSHSIAGVFLGQNAVCEGYSKTFEYLMDRAGIPNIIIFGEGDGEPHAWNAIEYKGEWYLMDITWDDPNEEDEMGFNNTMYTYFFMPSSLFSQKHTPYSEDEYYCYPLPDFSDNIEESFFGRYKCYTAEGLDAESGPAFANRVLANRYKKSDYIYIAFPKGSEQAAIRYVIPVITGIETPTNIQYSNTPYGSMIKLLAPVIDNPATDIFIDNEEVIVKIGDEAELNVTISENSDDRIIWELETLEDGETYTAKRVAKLTTSGRKAVVKGIKNGTVILKATLYSSTLSDEPISVSCKIIVGTGEPSSDVVIFQNGTKEYKSATITPTIRAGTWKDSKGKEKTGKLVWFVSDTPAVPSFNYEKHTVSMKSAKSKKASVNAKGVVTAKQNGTVFVYVCDTGTFTYEEFEVDILAAPSKLFVTDTPGSAEKDNILKKYGLNAGSADRVYIFPYVKNGQADTDCTYKVKIAKEDKAQYLKVGTVKTDEKGNLYFEITALDFDRTKNKPVTVKLEISCEQSNKKTSLSIVVGNPVLDASLVPQKKTGTELKLAEKNDTLEFKLIVETNMDDVDVTTDKIKIYVGKTTVELNDHDKPVFDKGASVKANFDSKTMKLTLKATKDKGVPAIITAAFTDSITKEITLIDLATIDENGVCTIL